MKRNMIYMLLLVLSAAAASGETETAGAYKKQREAIENRYAKARPKTFSQWTPGVKFRIDTNEKIKS